MYRMSVSIDSLLKMAENLISQADSVLDRAISNRYLMTTLKVFIALYAALAAPKLPVVALRLLNFTLVRIAIAFAIVLIALKEPTIALLVAIAFIVSLQYADQQALWDTTMSVADEGELSWLPSSKTPTQVNVELPNVSEDNLGEQPIGQVGNLMMGPSESSMNGGMNGPTNGPEVSPMGMGVVGVVGETPGSTAVMPPVNAGLPVNGALNSGMDAMEFFSSTYGIPSAVADPQNNMVPSADQMSSVQTYRNQWSAQGLVANAPGGFEPISTVF